jgi:GH25 family lysozyme M1 (1,4-beta-N-acetylmuramidase)
MKNNGRGYNYLLFVLVLLIGVLSFLSVKISNSFHPELIVEETKKIDDSNVWSFLDNTAEMVFPEVKEEIKEEVKEEKKEDPETALKKQAAETKGVAKKKEVKEEVKKYETNETSFGIDVSEWQGNIDWKKVKKSGVSFAMIRVGYRTLDSGRIAMDDSFLDNIKGALANQINVGIYFFSMAKDTGEAREEAEWVYNVIKDYDITYPVAIDSEFFNRYRLTGVSNATLTDNAIVFCDYIKSKGYTPMIYSYANAFNNYFETARFANYRIWVAQFNDEITYKGKYHMWQNTSDGRVDGIRGRVDMDVAYFSVTNDVTKASVVNGVTNLGDLEVVEFKDLEMETTLTKDVMLRTSPYTSLPNKAGTLRSGSNITVTGLSNNFVRIEYNNDVFYINDTECFEMILNEVSFDSVRMDVVTNKDVELLSSPYSFLDNKVADLPSETAVEVVGLNPDFTKIKYDENIYYVYDVDFYDVIKDYRGSSSN